MIPIVTLNTRFCKLLVLSFAISMSVFSAQKAFSQCDLSVTIEQLPVPVCFGDTVTLIAHVTGGNPPYVFIWTPNPAPPFWTPSPGDSIISFVNHGAYGFGLEVTDDNGCTISNSHASKPVLTHLDFDIEFDCNSANSLYEITVTNPYGGDYLWNTGETTIKIIGSPGNSYSVTVTAANGCTRSIETGVLLPISYPNIDLDGPAEICINTEGVLTATPPGIGYLYEWSTGSSGIGNTTTISSPGFYAVTVTAPGYHCPGNANIFVGTIPPIPPILSSPPILCPNSPGPVNVVNSSIYSQFEWNDGQTTPTIQGENNSAYTVTVTEPNGCTSTGSVSIDEYLVLYPYIVALADICVGQETWEWQVVPPLFTSFQWSTGATSPTIIINQPGDYALTVTDANGCTSTAVQLVEPAPMPAPIIPPVPAACNGAAQQVTVEGGPFQTYAWSTGATTSSINVAQAGTYAVTVTNQRGCSATTSTTVSIGTPANAAINVAATGCSSSALLTATGGNSFIWSTGETTANINISTSGTYAVTTTNAGGCTASASTAVTLSTPPPLSVNGPASICTGNAATLTASSGFASYTWSSGETGPSISTGLTGNYSVTATDAIGCTATATFPLLVNSAPQATIAGPSTLCTGNTGQLVVNGDFSSCVWSNGSVLQSITVSQPGNYTVTVTNVQGCTATASQVLTVSSTLAVSVTQTISGCNGTASLNASVGYDNYLWSNGENTPSISVTQPGNYSVTVSETGGCTGSAASSIAFPIPPSVSINGPVSACTGTATSLSASNGFAAYLWSNGESTPIIPVMQSGIYSVTVTDAAGCTATASQQISIFPLPAFSLTGPSSICTGGSAVFSLSQNFPQTTWSTGASTSSITISLPGTYAVTVTDDNGCTATATQQLSVSTSLSPTIAQTIAPCLSIASLDAGPGYISYLWSNGATGQTIDIAQAGSYSVTVSDASGCTGEVEQAISFPSLPQVAILGTSSICTGGSAIFSLSQNFTQTIWSTGATTSSITTTQPGNYAVTVTDANGCTAIATQQLSVSTSLSPTIAPTIAPCLSIASLDAGPGYTSYLWSNGATGQAIDIAQAGNYSVTVGDASGCTGEVTQSISFPSLPQVQVLGPSSFCENESVQFSLSGSFPAVNWSTGSTANNISVSLPGNYTVTVTDANGCTATASKALTENPAPTPVVSATNIGCNGTGTLTAGTGFSSYLWSNGATTPTISVTQSGSYSVIVTNLSGCSGTGQMTINLPTPPQVSISGASQLCEGYEETLSAPANFVSYLWSTGSVLPQITITTGGTYSLTATDGNSCTATASWAVTLLPTQYSFFQNNSCSLLDTGTVVTSLTSQTGCDSVVTVATILDPTLTANLSLSACPGETTLFSGVQIIAGSSQEFVLTSSLGCDSILIVTVEALPAVGIDWQTKPSCWNGSDGSITLSALAGTPPFRFAMDGGVFQESPVFPTLQAGNYSVLAEDGNGCISEAEIVVPATPRTVILLEDAALHCGEAATMLSPKLLAGDTQAVKWQWSNGATTPDIQVTTTGKFTLTADDGCEMQDLTATVLPAADWERDYFYVPSSFSPNSDGFNDFFMPFSNPEVEVRSFEFRVFDRWGNSVYSTYNPFDIGWDGLHRLTEMQNAVFGWYLKATVGDCVGEDMKLFREGGVTIVR